MFRNREFRNFALLQTVLAVSGIAAGFFVGTATGILALLISAAMMLTTFIFTKWRYRRLAELSDYLNQICSGRYDLDIRDNEEGELSILKNDIYKVTLRLSEQTQMLQKDKKTAGGCHIRYFSSAETPFDLYERDDGFAGG